MFLISRLKSQAPQTLTMLLVFSLSSGVLGGILLYMDSSGPYVLSEMSENVPLHFSIHFTESYYEQDDVSFEEINSIVSSQEGVSDTEHIVMINGHYEYLWRAPIARFVCLGVSESFFDTFPDMFSLPETNLPLVENSCYIAKSIYEKQGMAIGEEYELRVIEEGRGWGSEVSYVYANLTVLGVFEDKKMWGSHDSYYGVQPVLQFITPLETMTTKFISMGYDETNALHDQIWGTFSASFLSQASPEEAEENLNNVRRRIEQRTFPSAVVGSFDIINIVQDYATWNSNILSIALAFSIPSIVMGIMLVYSTNKLLSDRRRQDVGMLRVRGASNRQSLSWILNISGFVGLVGGVGAMLTGVLAAYMSGITRGLFVFDFSLSSDFVMFFHIHTLALVFLFSFTMGLLVSIPSVISTLLMTATEAHKELKREQDEDEEELANPVIDVIVVAVSGLLIVQLIVLLNISFSLSTMWLFTVLVVGSFGAFIVFTVRLLSRTAAPFKARVMETIDRPSWTVGLRVVGRSARLRIKSETLGVMFIAMVFTAGVFSATAATTGSSHLDDLYNFQVGADIVVDIKPSMYNITSGIVDDILAIDGVLSASAVLVWTCQAYYETVGPVAIVRHYSHLTLYCVQPTEFTESAFILPSFTKNLNPEEAFSRLEEDNHNVISSFRPVIGYDVAPDRSYQEVYGDLLDVWITGQESEDPLNISIVDIMSINEDEDSETFMPGSPDDKSFLVADIDLVRETLDIDFVNKLYIDIEAGANYTRIIEDIDSLAPHSFSDIESSQRLIDETTSSRTGSSIYGVYTLNVLFSMIYLTIGVGVVAIQKNRLFRKQFAIIRSMGCELKTILGTMLLDSVLGITISAVIGISVGLILSLMVLNLPFAFVGLTSSIDWYRLPIAISIPFGLLSFILILSFVIPMIATYFVTKHSFSQGVVEELHET